MVNCTFLAFKQVKSLLHLPRLSYLSMVAALLILIGCSKRYHDLPPFLPFNIEHEDNQSVGRFKTSYLAQQIDHYYRGTDPGPIGVTSFVNLDNLYASSSFGRFCAEQLISELSMLGYEVVELRQSDSIQFLNSEGEFRLSREVDKVRPHVDLGGILVGTYTVSPVRVYLNLRLLDPNQSLVLAAASAELGKTKEIEKLLRGRGGHAPLERIPFRTLVTHSMPFGGYPNQMMGGFMTVPQQGYNNSPSPPSKRLSKNSKRNPLELRPSRDLKK